MKILIVEDEIELLIAISNYLVKEQYICELADTYTKAQEKISIYEYDVILLDITLPDGNGIDLLKAIKQKNSHSGVIIISAKNSLNDKITGLDLGADDYMTKPFQLSELNSRIRAVIRRGKFNGNSLIKFNEVEINTDNKEVKVNGNKLKLTKPGSPRI